MLRGLPTSQGTPTTASSHQELSEAEQGPSTGAPRGPALQTPGFRTPGPQNRERRNCSKPPDWLARSQEPNAAQPTCHLTEAAFALLQPSLR